MRRAAGDWRVFISGYVVYCYSLSFVPCERPVHLATPKRNLAYLHISDYSVSGGPTLDRHNFKGCRVAARFHRAACPTLEPSMELVKKGEPWEPGMTVERWFRVPQFNKQDFLFVESPP